MSLSVNIIRVILTVSLTQYIQRVTYVLATRRVYIKSAEKHESASDSEQTRAARQEYRHHFIVDADTGSDTQIANLLSRRLAL